ncbi:T9SS C-terminal target domain-containing protein [Lutibacter sp. HS1-25]|uniref:polysaccharide lyase family 7 protein n=1 Tax=Lutibacter sp. HS1-25 TaxID=2485000 RepID=UPI001011EF3B|nr:polysaccharide lyase family 7 protein [Lutibacter sp. HS1-25]RXP56150.1 T9SS C-terminal target domain-containing protein [Lutibacter sp. HS1-25]
MKIYLQKRLCLFALCMIGTYFTIPVIAQVPSDLIENCKQWKITYPTGAEDKTLCGEPNNEFFYVNGTRDAIVFRAPIRSNNGTTPNSSNIRSELRERLADGSADIYWTTTGTHMVYVKQAITHLPINKPHLVATQIHGNKDDGIDDSMVMRLENSHLFLTFNGGKLRSDITIKTNYTLGTIHEVIFRVVDGKHYCYYSEDGNLLSAYNSGNASSYLVKDGGNDYVMDLNYDQSYFKVGNYTQSNADEEGSDTDNPNNYGEVLVYDFSVNHGVQKVTGVTLLPSTVDLIIGSTKQLSSSISPSNASNLAISYSSNNPLVAKVNPTSGLVTAESEGSATITVITDDGGFTDTSLITVVTPSIGDNLALNKPITGSGIHDADYIVENLVDGLTSTKWSVSGFPQTAIIDLGAVYTLGRTEMVCHSDRDYQFTVSVSSTVNGTYTQIVDRSANTTQGTLTHPIIDTFSGIDGRFVKVTISGAATYTGTWMSLTEFRVFAGETLSIGDDISSSEKAVLLWPNPATNTVNISGNYNFDTLTVYNQLGKLVMNQAIQSKSVEISHLIPGLYIFKLTGYNKTVNQRILKQ